MSVDNLIKNYNTFTLSVGVKTITVLKLKIGYHLTLDDWTTGESKKTEKHLSDKEGLQWLESNYDHIKCSRQ